jgi:MOSC domain-containing protein YiiM
MKPVESTEAIENFGLKDDRHAIPDSLRQVLLLEKETLDGMNLFPGQIKENITTVGISLTGLELGCRLQIGESVLMEITKSCSPCNRMEEIRVGLLRELAGKRGMLARIIRGGIIHRGDRIIILGNA